MWEPVFSGFLTFTVMDAAGCWYQVRSRAS
jgi:hypothetical protein